MLRLIGLLILCGSLALASPKEEVSNFLQTLSSDQRTLLDRFFRILIEDSFTGYVLFGDKPMCIEVHSLPLESGALSGINTEGPILAKGVELWEKFEVSPKDKDFLFLSKQTRKHSSFQHDSTSLGFTTLAQELDSIKNLVTISRKIRPFDYCSIPYFGCKSDTEETRHLLDIYEKNRQGILKIFQNEDFLENVLIKLFSLENTKISIPSTASIDVHFQMPNKKHLSKTLATLINQEFDEENNSYKTVFLQGVRFRESGKDVSSRAFKKHGQLYQVEEALQCCENLEKANGYFDQLSKDHDLTALVLNKLYFKVLKHGEGPIATAKANSFSFHYSYHFEEETIADNGTIKHEDLERFIPGIAKALIEMKRGEQRRVYLHPEYGYGENTYFSPNMSIIADIELIDFNESASEAILSQSHQLKKRNPKELLLQYQNLLSEQYYSNGVDFKDFFQKKGDLIDLEEFEKNLNCQNQPPKKTEAERTKIISDLYCPLLISPNK